MTLWAHAALTPDKPALIMSESGRTLTFRELDERSLTISGVFARCGLLPGDAIAVYMENHPDYLPIYFGAVRSGLYFVPLNRHLTAAEVAYIVADSGARLVVASPRGAAAGQLPSALPGVRLFCADGTLNGYESLPDALDQIGRVPDTGNIRGVPLYYSSGTTGRPKGIRWMLSGKSFEDSPGFETFLSAQFRITPDTVYLSTGPNYHAAPLTYPAVVIASGGTSVIMERFDAARSLALIEAHTVTMSQWVPTMFKRLLELPPEVRRKYGLGSHREALVSAAPCPAEIKRAMIDWWGPIVTEYYGASETYGMALSTSEQWLTHPGSVGPAVLGVPHICNESGEELPPGQPGLIYFERNTDVFQYHNDPGKTERSRHPRHPFWRTVGDIGYLGEDGYLYLTDRQAHTIISGGTNIYPQEIEDALITHPEVADAAVIGVPHADLGEAVKAVVVLQPGVPAQGQEQALLSWLAGRIARYKLPRSVDFVAGLPRLENGKLYKHKLREQYQSASDDNSSGDS
jgi:long-chain acyl-CoA synthetase